jgi:poly(hydroxyalkanoate) depolymerase family esterase
MVTSRERGGRVARVGRGRRAGSDATRDTTGISLRRFPTLLAAALLAAAWLTAGNVPARAAELVPLPAVGSNPGALEGFKAAPAAAPSGAPLVVVLHGCLMQAADMHAHSGLAELAEELQLYLVYPQQPASNNSMYCFNWFLPENQTRDGGESLSIKQMVDQMRADYSIDGGRVFAVGVSAGAATVANLLAAWPEVFAAGALMAGLPARCAGSLSGAQACQQGSVDRSPQEWGDLVRQASPGYAGSYPRVVLFQGTADAYVAPMNQEELVEQWTDVHGVAAVPTATDTVGGHAHARYDRDGTPVVATFTLAGMGHGMAVGAADPVRPCGQAGAWFEDRGLCSAYWSLSFFGLTGDGGSGDGGSGDGGGGGGGDGGGDDGGLASDGASGTDARAGAGGTPPGGCGCATGRGAPGVWGAALLGLWLALRLSRRGRTA